MPYKQWHTSLSLLTPVLQHGFALSPAVHNVFFRVLQNIIDLKPRSKYILAVDDSKNTLEEVVKVESGDFQSISCRNKERKKNILFSSYR